MKKVLFVATITNHINGFHIPYLKLFKENGYEVHVATGDNINVVNFCDKKFTIKVKRKPIKFDNLKAIKQLEKIINNERYDIIHCHTPMGGVVARLAAKKMRKKNITKVIYTAHGFHFYKGSPLKNWIIYYTIEKWLSKYTDTLITINKEDYEIAKRKFNKTNVKYIPGVGIDFKKFNIMVSEKEKNILRKEMGLKESDFIMIFPARLDNNKNQILLINVMEKIVKQYSNIHLLLPGRDELNGYYQKIVHNKNLDKNIHFLGYRNDISKLLKISNLSVSSSLREGLPVNILEAIFSNIPVIALNCRGMKDLIKNGENGYIVNSEEEFYELIKKIYEKKIELSVKNDNIQKFSIENTLKEIKKIYEL